MPQSPEVPNVQDLLAKAQKPSTDAMTLHPFYRGKIETKNLGKIDMYFVNRIKPEYSQDKFGILPNDLMINKVNKL